MAFLLYSGKTSLTAPKIAEALDIPCGRRLEPRHNVIINYGAGSFTPPAGTNTIINHPRYRRNKLNMLSYLDRLNEINIPSFVPANQVHEALRTGHLRFPIIGRSLQHQSGSGYWLCLSNRVMEWALRSGAAYFQQWEDINNEYRVHVFRNQSLGCYKKVLREHPIEDLGRNIARAIIDDVPNLNEEQIMKVVKKTARHMTNPDFNIRSLHRGWYFRIVHQPPPSVVNMAINAVRGSGLDFGAVDMMQLDNNEVKFIELNTGPGMDVGSRIFNNYVRSFRNIINTTNPQPQPARIFNADNRRGVRRRRNVNR